MFKLNSIKSKLIFLLSFIILVFLSGFIASIQFEKSRLNLILNDRIKEEAVFLEKIIELKSSNMLVFAKDYTFYDEMVSFIKTGNKKWADENVEPALVTFKINAIWIYRTNLSQIYSINNLDSSDFKNIPFSTSSFKEIFDKNKLPRFFVSTKQGIMEIVGATIHPTFDIDRKTAPQGYLFGGRLWDQAYLDELSRLTESRIEVLPYNGDRPLTYFDKDQNSIFVSKVLYQWDGSPIAQIYAKSEVLFLRELIRSYNIGLISFIFLSIIILITLSFFLNRWIIAPLSAISKSLTSRDPSFLDDIRVYKSEFADIFSLLRTFFKQQERLYTEVKEHKQTAKELLESQTRLKTIFDLSLEAIYLVKPEGRIIDCNPSASEMTGYSKEELLQMSVFDLIPEEPRMKIIGIINDSNFKNIHIGEYSNIKKNGENFPVKMGIKSAEIENEKFFIVIVRDITEKKKMEKKLLKAQQIESLGILAGGIAHDFNNLLTGIMGNIGLAKMFSNQGDKIYERLTIAEKACIKAKDLTQQLLTFSKGGAPVKEAASIRDIITESVGFALSGANVKCNLDIPEDLWMIEADIGQISQVINNLLINALEAMPQGGIIDISAKNIELVNPNELNLSPGKYVMISIGDYGKGITSEHLPKIFDPYFTTKPGGSGLGLSVVYSIIKRHKGYITVDSTLNSGTIFTFYLPAIGKVDILAKTVPSDIINGEGKVLIMDDDDIIRDTVSSLLQHLNYKVEQARDGKEALDIYKKALDMGSPFSVVILDLTVPGGMGGKETIKALLELDPHVKAIVSSGYSEDPIMSNYKEYGFKGVVTKPFTVKALNDMLLKVISQE